MWNSILAMFGFTALALSGLSIFLIRKKAGVNAIENASRIQQVSDKFLQLVDDVKKEVREEYAKRLEEERQLIESIRSCQQEQVNEIHGRISALEQQLPSLLEQQEKSRHTLQQFQDALAEISEAISRDKSELDEKTETLRREAKQATGLNGDSLESIRVAMENLQKSVLNQKEEILGIEGKIRTEKDAINSVSVGFAQAMNRIMKLETGLQATEAKIREYRASQETQDLDISKIIADSRSSISEVLSRFSFRLVEIEERIRAHQESSAQVELEQERKTSEITSEIQSAIQAIGKIEADIPGIVAACVDQILLQRVDEMKNGLAAHESDTQLRIEALKNAFEAFSEQVSSLLENHAERKDLEKVLMKVLTTRQRLHSLVSFVAALRKTLPVVPLVTFGEAKLPTVSEPELKRDEEQIPDVSSETETKPVEEGTGEGALESQTSETEENREDAEDQKEPQEVIEEEELEPESEDEQEEDSHRIEPIRRGGQRLGYTREAGPTGKRECIDILCLNRGTLWEVFGRIPKRVLRYSPSVFENNEKALWGKSYGELPITRLKGTLRCEWIRQGFPETIEREFGQDDFLLFKMMRQGTLSKMVSEHSAGDYICIVPWNYTREEEISGRPFESPEPCSIDGARVHFFHITAHSGIAFRRPDGSILKVMSSWQEFRLEGNTSPYLAGPNGEPIFFLQPPAIVAEQDACWNNVGRIVIRSDIEGEKRERRYFLPVTGKSRQIHIPEGLESSGGHYTVLLYDRHDGLLESHPFAFHRGLRGIDVGGYDPFGVSESNRTLTMNLLHFVGYEPVLESTELGPFIEIESGRKETTVLISISPECETLNWKIRPGKPDEMRFQTNLPFLWWGIGKEMTDLILGNQPLEVVLKTIRPASGFKLFVRVPVTASNLKARFSAAGFAQQRLHKEEGFWTIEMAELGAAITLNPAKFAEFRTPLVLSLEDGEKAHKIHLADYIVRKKCVFCEEKRTEGEMKTHLKEKHEDEICSEFFRELTYDEIAEADRSLPAKIYKCTFPGCLYYLKVSYEDALENPTSGILNHFEREHRGKQPSFRPVTSIEEIRKNLLSTLCETWRCEVCGEDFTSREEMLKHAMTEHLDRLATDGGD
jgi:hypothetical protein